MRRRLKHGGRNTGQKYGDSLLNSDFELSKLSPYFCPRISRKAFS